MFNKEDPSFDHVPILQEKENFTRKREKFINRLKYQKHPQISTNQLVFPHIVKDTKNNC